MIEKDLGIVLKRINFRETSLIVSLFTRRFGKISGILKGFYSSKKEFTASMDIFSLNEFVFYPKRSTLWLISFADLVRDFSYLRNDLEKNCVACKFIDTVNHVLPLWDRNENIFLLLNAFLDYFVSIESRKALYIFFIKFLNLYGLRPHFNACVKCHKELNRDFFFSASCGGLLCNRCKHEYNDSEPVTAEAAATILYIQNAGFPQVLRINPTLKCEEEISGLLNGFLSHHLHLNLLGKWMMADYKR